MATEGVIKCRANKAAVEQLMKLGREEIVTRLLVTMNEPPDSIFRSSIDNSGVRDYALAVRLASVLTKREEKAGKRKRTPTAAPGRTISTKERRFHQWRSKQSSAKKTTPPPAPK